MASGHAGKHRRSQLAGFSERTQYAYVRAVRKLAAHYGQSPDQLTEAQVRDDLLFLKNERKFSPSALKIAHSGIKFFYSHTVVRDWTTLLKLRVPRHKTLPDVLSIDEVHRLLEAVRHASVGSRNQPAAGHMSWEGPAAIGIVRLANSTRPRPGSRNNWRACCPVPISC